MKAKTAQLAEAYVNLTASKEGKDLEAVAAAFVKFLAEEGLVHKSRELIRALDRAWQKKFGVANVSIATAHPLSPAAFKALEAVVHGADITQTVDPSLIGGAKIRVDDRLLDGSIAGQLKALHQSHT